MRSLYFGALFFWGCSQYLDFSSTSATDARLADTGIDVRVFDARGDVASDAHTERSEASADATRESDTFLLDGETTRDTEVRTQNDVAFDTSEDSEIDSNLAFDVAAADVSSDVGIETSADAAPDISMDAPPAIPAPGFLTLGTYHSCASFSDNGVCWGRSYRGDIANLQVSDVVQMDTHRESACAVHRNGSISCWGSNFYGALGDGTTDTRQTPASVVDLSEHFALEVAVGADFACARFQDGSVRCWGINNYGQLGIGSSVSQSERPVLVTISDVIQITAGSNHICALVQNGDVRCWGAGIEGQLGDGRRAPSNVPVRASLSSASRVENIAAGGNTSCLVTRAGDVYCWGINSEQQTGNPREGIGGALQFDTPRHAFGGVQIGAELAVGSTHACVREGASVRCWGGNYQSQLGQGYTSFGTWEPQLVDVEAWNGHGSLRVGGAHTCVRRPDASLMCWGSNQEGQIGSATALQTTPWLVSARDYPKPSVLG